MSSQEVEALVVGGGQAGLAMSEHLSGCGVPHLVVERNRIAERWRSERWDSLVANGPAWHDRFPGLEFVDLAPDEFASKDQIVAYFEAYAEKIAAPVPSVTTAWPVRWSSHSDPNRTPPGAANSPVRSSTILGVEPANRR